jgi:DNA invertase Pin-like site-specific DNA recombinase
MRAHSLTMKPTTGSREDPATAEHPKRVGDARTLIGYARISKGSDDADLERGQLTSAGVLQHNLYADRCGTGARSSRPQLDRAIDALQTGDTLVITSLGRLGRSTLDLLDVIQTVQRRKAALRVLDI